MNIRLVGIGVLHYERVRTNGYDELIRNQNLNLNFSLIN